MELQTSLLISLREVLQVTCYSNGNSLTEPESLDGSLRELLFEHHLFEKR